jgi:hypothetical protein
MRRVALVLSLVASVASAQQSSPPKSERKAPVKNLDFTEGDLIDGARLIPLGDIYLAKPKPGFKSLITVRTNFNDKLLASVNEL